MLELYNSLHIIIHQAKGKMDLDSDATEDERHFEAEKAAPAMGKRRTSSVRFDDKPTVVSFEK